MQLILSAQATAKSRKGSTLLIGISLGANSDRNHCMAHGTWDHASYRVQQHHCSVGLLPVPVRKSVCRKSPHDAKFLFGMAPHSGRLASQELHERLGHELVQLVRVVVDARDQIPGLVLIEEGHR